MKGKEYVRPIPAGAYFFSRPTWSWFMVREFTSVFVGAYALFLIVLIYQAHDEQSFAAFYEGLRSPLSLILHLIGLVMVVYHTVTWFKTTPQALPSKVARLRFTVCGPLEMDSDSERV